MDCTQLPRRIAALVEEHYVLPDRIAAISVALETLDPPSSQADPAALAERITTVLHGASGDLHLRLKQVPNHGEDSEPWQTRMTREAHAFAGGIKTVSRIDADTALITIAPYLSARQLAEPYVDAAFGLVGTAGRLVIDVREGRGGTPETVALICSYLLGDEPVHLQDVVERRHETRAFWTAPTSRRLDAGVQVAVLTSAATFSGCEELAYDLQALGRATVVGEQTRGGAHPVRPFVLGDGLEL